MNTLKVQKESLVKKALNNRVLSENISVKLNTEEIIYLKRLMLICNNFSIESFLGKYVSEYEVSNDYKYYLMSKKESEENQKSKIENILHEAIKELPEDIVDLLATYLISVLYNDFQTIELKIKKMLSNELCIKFLEDLEMKLNLGVPIIRTNILKYIKQKYSIPQDHYYTDLIINYTGFLAMGLLYIFFER